MKETFSIGAHAPKGHVFVRGNFRQDLKESELVEQFLDTEVYPYLFDSTDRKKTTDFQFAGVDIICDGVKCDEKAQIAYKNSPLPTQVLELSFLSKSRSAKRRRGWFIDDSLDTEYYIFVFFPKVANVAKRWDRLQDVEQLEKVEILVVDKKQVQKMVSARADFNTLAKAGNAMRAGELPNRHVINGIKLVHSHKLAESPVNIVMSKKDFPVLVHAWWTKDSGLDIDEDNR